MSRTRGASSRAFIQNNSGALFGKNGVALNPATGLPFSASGPQQPWAQANPAIVQAQRRGIVLNDDGVQIDPVTPPARSARAGACANGQCRVYRHDHDVAAADSCSRIGRGDGPDHRLRRRSEHLGEAIFRRRGTVVAAASHAAGARARWRWPHGTRLARRIYEAGA